MPRIALYQPDIAGNVGTILRTAACFGMGCDIIEPCGFAFGDRALKRAGMDYAARADIVRHADWDHFYAALPPASRLVLMSSSGAVDLYDAGLRADDVILMGSEGAGVPPHVHDAAHLRIRIPMQPGFRSLNVAVAAGIAMAEAIRQAFVTPSPFTEETP